MSSRKKERKTPDTITPPVKDDDNICSADDSSCPESCVSEDEENTSC